MVYGVTGLFHRALRCADDDSNRWMIAEVNMSTSYFRGWCRCQNPLRFPFYLKYHHVVSFIQRCAYRRSGCRRARLQRFAANHPLLQRPSPLHHPQLHQVPRPLAAAPAVSYPVDSCTRVEPAPIPAWISLKRSNENYISIWYQDVLDL